MSQQIGRTRYMTGPGVSARSGRRRRRRGPAPIIIIALAIVAIIFCWVIGRGCGGSKEAKQREALRTYAMEINKLIGRSATIGTQFDSLRNKIADSDRDELDSEMEELTKEAAEIAGKSSQVEAAELAQHLQPLIQLCFDLRSSGLTEFKKTLPGIFEGENIDEAADNMAASLMDLVISDECLTRFRDALEKILKDNKVSMQEIAKSTYVPEPDNALSSHIQELIKEVRGTTESSEKRGLAVVGLSTTPARVDTTSQNTLVLPLSDSVVIKATIHNQGNQTEEGVSVEATLDYQGKSSPQKVTRKITRIKPNEKKVMIFEGLKPSEDDGVVNLVTVFVEPVKGELVEENNTMKIRFVMQSEE